jgi:beta-galactosidase/beta-glucuronidase
MDFLQPAGIYRDVRLEVVPGIYLEDVFVLPRNVLAAGRTVRVTASVQAATVPRGGAAAVTAALLDGDRTLATARATLRISRPCELAGLTRAPRRQRDGPVVPVPAPRVAP